MPKFVKYRFSLSDGKICTINFCIEVFYEYFITIIKEYANAISPDVYTSILFAQLKDPNFRITLLAKISPIPRISKDWYVFVFFLLFRKTSGVRVTTYFLLFIRPAVNDPCPSHIYPTKSR